MRAAPAPRSIIRPAPNGQQEWSGKLKPIRLAIVGAGWIAEQAYLPYLLRHDHIAVTAAYDPSAEALFRLAQAAGLSSKALSYEACLATHIDGIIVCTPAPVHSEWIAQAISAGKHVLCEKPVFRNRSEIPNTVSRKRLAELLMGSASMRLRSDVSLIWSWVRQGLLGSLHRVRLGWWREQGVPRPGSWRTDPVQSPLGVLEDLGPHLLDILASLTSSADWKEIRLAKADLSCRAGNSERGASWFGGGCGGQYVVPDRACATFTSDSGTSVDVEVCWTNDAPGDLCSFVFEGTNGRAEFNGLLGFSTARRSEEQYCSLELRGQAAQVYRFAPGSELQREAFANSIDIFARFCQNQCAPVANCAEIVQVAEWLTEIRDACQSSLPEPQFASSRG
jgi:predicted dehydrogenase